MSSGLARARLCGVALALYLAAGAVVLLPLWPHVRTHILADDAYLVPGFSDAYLFLWSHWWAQKAAAGPQGLFACRWVLPPTGVNLFYQTAAILPSVVTAPLARGMGTVAGYNTMVWLLLSGAGLGYFCFLRRTFAVSPVPAFVAGALFGFSPYAVAKAHVHLNLLGHAFWGGALAVLVGAYVRRRFTVAGGVAFAVLLWATFWSSFVEFFMLVVVCAFTVGALEIALPRERGRGLKAKARFLVPAAVGAVNLLVFRCAPGGESIRIELFDRLRLADLFSPAMFSMSAALWPPSEEEFWGVCLPLSVCVLAFLGYTQGVGKASAFARLVLLGVFAVGLELLQDAVDVLGCPGGPGVEGLARAAQVGGLVLLGMGLVLGPGMWWVRRRWPGRGRTSPGHEVRVALWGLALAGLVLSLDVLRLPSTVLRLLPLAQGFRVLGRFFPFVLFFLLVLAAQGLEWLWLRRCDWRAKAGMLGLAAAALVECAPCRLTPRPVPWFHVPQHVRDGMDRRAFVWLRTDTARRLDVDTYQVALDMPFAYLPHLGRGPMAGSEPVLSRYPIIYGRQTVFTPEQFMAEARALDVRYALFTSARGYKRFPVPHRVLATDGGKVLVALAAAR